MMADIFCREDAVKVLKNKCIYFIGDSNIRGIYNDLVYLLHKNDIMPPIILRKHLSKKDTTQLDLDKVIKKLAVSDATRNLVEIREFYLDEAGIRVRFCFITRVCGDQMKELLNDVERGNAPTPDIVVMNSCLWDLTRWGPLQELPYKQYMARVFARWRAILADEALFIWTSTLPLATEKVRGGLMIKQLEFLQGNIRFIVLEANLFAAELCKLFGFDLVDLHYHLRYQLARRSSDGIHWEPHALRHIMCILLTHIALSYELPLPGHLPSEYLQASVAACTNSCASADSQLTARLSSGMLKTVEKEVVAVLDGNVLADIDDRNRYKKRCFRRGGAGRGDLNVFRPVTGYGVSPRQQFTERCGSRSCNSSNCKRSVYDRLDKVSGDTDTRSNSLCSNPSVFWFGRGGYHSSNGSIVGDAPSDNSEYRTEQYDI